ncbi:MAG: cytochrome c biogenesis protein CcdA [Bacteroidota bacterium]
MKSIQIFCLVLFTLLFSSKSNAQNKPTGNPVFKITFSDNSPKTGEIIEIIIKADIPEGIHMYSTYNKCDVGPLPIVLNFINPTGYCTVDKPYSVGDKRANDPVFECEVGEFHHKAEIRQKIRVLAADIKVNTTIEGQWCTESECVGFGGLIPITLKGTLKATGTTIKCTEQIVENQETPETIPVIDTTKKIIDTATALSEIKSTTHSYKLSGSNDTGSCIVKTFNGQKSETDQEDNLGLFLVAFLSGLAGLLTPCVFPMIPMTVSFFLKDKKSKRKAINNGIFFGLSIIGIYVILGTVVSFVSGADAGNFISTHWLPNILFFIIFVIFAFSFFGAFEIVLPSRFANTVDREADKGGFYGIFFMALTLAIVSFSCTGPIVGSVLVESAKGSSFVRPVIAMLGFGLAFALPFSLFAIFPNWLNSLPKSGGWLNSVKVCFGFIELALGLKFLSTADQTYHWHLLDREVYLCLWIIIFGLMGIYLLGKLKFSHDSELKYLKVPRLLLAITTLSFVMYMIPGLWGAPLKFLSGYLPPMSTQDFDINRSIREAQGIKGNLCKKPSYSNELHIPHGLSAYYDYDEAVACSKELKKPLFIDFTGHGCVNCRKMEEKVWSDPRVLKILNEDYVIASLYVDDKKIKLPSSEYFKGRFSQREITTLGNKNAEIEQCYFGASSQPLYCLLDGKEDLLQKPVGSVINDKQFNTEEFLKFLENGVKEYKLRNPVKK